MSTWSEMDMSAQNAYVSISQLCEADAIRHSHLTLLGQFPQVGMQHEVRKPPPHQKLGGGGIGVPCHSRDILVD